MRWSAESLITDRFMTSRAPASTRELVEEHRRHDDPADGKKPEGGPVEGGGQGRVGRHADNSHGDCQGGGKACSGGRVGRPARPRQKPQQGHQRQRRHER